MRGIGKVFCFAACALALSAPAQSTAGPIRGESETTVDHSEGACATWIRPSGDQYEWTTLCGSIVDQGDDGTIDSRYVFIQKSLCEGDGSPQGPVSFQDEYIVIGDGTLCYASPALLDEPLDESQFSTSLSAGTARLDAELESCSLHLTWNAGGEAQSDTFDEAPRINPHLTPPAVGISIQSYSHTSSAKEATLTGAPCPLADVTGSPSNAFVGEFETAETWRHIIVDPTAV